MRNLYIRLLKHRAFIFIGHHRRNYWNNYHPTFRLFCTVHVLIGEFQISSTKLRILQVCLITYMHNLYILSILKLEYLSYLTSFTIDTQ